jgi:toxin CcdB
MSNEMVHWLKRFGSSMIRQFDVIPNPLRTGHADRPYLISIQHRFLDAAASCLLAPLSIARAFHHWPRLNPQLLVLGQPFFLVPTDLISLSLKHLRDPIANLEPDRDRIVAALDLVFTGV